MVLLKNLKIQNKFEKKKKKDSDIYGAVVQQQNDTIHILEVECGQNIVAALFFVCQEQVVPVW
jgi:hypothetical protein